jgi:hypothetical protein
MTQNFARQTVVPLPLTVVNGGTGAATLTGVLTGNGTAAITANAVTQYGTVIAGASNAVSSVAPSATSGVPYISQGATANPVFGTAVVAGGGTGIATTTAYAPICGGTTATGNFQAATTGIAVAGTVFTSNGNAALPSFQAMSVGRIVQVVYASSGALITVTGTIPDDDTIPQKTEGTEVITCAITPTNASNILEITFTTSGFCHADYINTIALFQDATANAVAAISFGSSSSYGGVPGQSNNGILLYQMVAGTTSSTTFKIRMGNGNAGEIYINGTDGAARLYGGVASTVLKITEIKV